MTNQEAISAINGILNDEDLCSHLHQAEKDALRMAIEAFEKQKRIDDTNKFMKDILVRMRDTTPEEQQAISDYYGRISPIGINIFDLCD